MDLSTLKCPDCGAALTGYQPGATTRCAYCGGTVVPSTGAGVAPRAEAAADVLCKECGHANRPHFKFCLGCGGRL